MESPKHRKQAGLLVATLVRHLAPRPDVFVGANMALYYSLLQTRSHDFKAPDFFVVLGALPDRERKSWVVWEEDGRVPNVVIELVSPTTEDEDRGRKMHVYARLGVGEYFLVDPHDLRLEGYRLDPAIQAWRRIPEGPDGDLDSVALGLRLGPASGTFEEMTATWIRWKTPEGVVLPTGEEAERERAERLAARLRALGVDPG